MTPTNELRFVEREHREPFTDHWNIRLDESGNQVFERVWTTQTLQQKFVGNDTYSGSKKEEWRDVPVVKEGDA